MIRKEKAVNDAIYCLTILAPAARDLPNNESLMQEQEKINDKMLQELGLTAEDINVISASALRHRAQDAKNYINELYEECRQYKRKEIDKAKYAPIDLLKNFKNNPKFATEFGITAATTSIKINDIGRTKKLIKK
jgi:translation elongation factor EF-Tu-like GTPase